MQPDFNMDTLAEKIIARVSFEYSVPPKWLKLNQATKYSNIGKERLIQLARDKIIDGFQDPDLITRPWVFDADSIDQYRRAQLQNYTDDSAKDFALDLMGKIGH